MIEKIHGYVEPGYRTTLHGVHDIPVVAVRWTATLDRGETSASPVCAKCAVHQAKVKANSPHHALCDACGECIFVTVTEAVARKLIGT